MKHTPPVACDLGVFTPEERVAHAALGRRLLAAATGIERDARSATLTLPASLRTAAERWAEDEQRCCPFLAFAVRDHGPVAVLEIRGSEAALAAFRAAVRRA